LSRPFCVPIVCQQKIWLLRDVCRALNIDFKDFVRALDAEL
jgi:hypothetical protein